jgi:hypothetical protein
MTITMFLQLLSGVLQFPNEFLALYNALKTTPEEQHTQLVAAIQKEQTNIQQTGRPNWT